MVRWRRMPAPFIYPGFMTYTHVSFVPRDPLRYLRRYKRVEVYVYERIYSKSFFDGKGQEWRPGIVMFCSGDQRIAYVYYDTYPERLRAKRSRCLLL